MALRDIFLNKSESEPNDNSYLAVIQVGVQNFQVRVETEQRYVEILTNYKYFTR